MSVKQETSGNESEDSLELRVCRACLATDVKLFDLHKNGLAESFEDVLGTPVYSTDGLPQHVCNYCYAELKRNENFRLRCRSAQYFCQEVLLQKILLTTSVMKTISNKKLQIPLSISKVVTLEYIPTDEDPSVFDNPNSSLSDTIKQEITLKNIKENDVPVKSENTILFEESDLNITEDIFGEEFFETDFEKSNDGTSILEEVLKKPKTKRKKAKSKEKVKKETKKRKVKEEEEEIEKPKRSRKYNQKYEEDFESFSKQCNVEVIFLTKEQQLESILARKESYKEHRFICDVCYMGFFTENAHKKHMEKHDPARGSHVCEVCQQYFTTRKLYLCHARIHKRQFICKICNQVNKSTSRAKLHHQWHEGFKFECPHCKKMFNAQSTKMNHIREHHTKATCDICDETIEGTVGLNKHKATMHGSAGDKPSKGCSDCGVLFLNSKALSRHKSVTGGCNTSLKPCPVCGDNFTMKDLQHHATEMHNGQIFKCNDCPSTFTSDRKLGIHWARTHAPRAPGGEGEGSPCVSAKAYMCEICANKFATPVQLKYHQRMHTDERPHSCPLCPKKFRVPGNLRVHLNIHTGERPFKCRFCPETFKSYSQRHKHKLLVHTKERRFKCHMCEKAYVLSFDLKSHIQFTHMHVPRPPRNRNRHKQQ